MSQLVLLHYPQAYSQPVGVWYWDSEGDMPANYYVPGSEMYEVSASGILGTAKNETQWNNWITRLADRTPYPDGYEVDEINTAPKKFLELTRKSKP